MIEHNNQVVHLVGDSPKPPPPPPPPACWALTVLFCFDAAVCADQQPMLRFGCFSSPVRDKKHEWMASDMHSLTVEGAGFFFSLFFVCVVLYAYPTRTADGQQICSMYMYTVGAQ